ncbi:MAG: DNA-binding transcriptional repressor/biotin-[acetyl-CoA-carboxylase] ligase BirA [Candidatus Westeberhardia cardiocondylae]|nr:DNA-binding transcriptional repressor/biotin-[acetyl-CoA-carboxylase] ligase BirA [Candidatus Westeberhardia cardiocondylae]
MSQNFLNKKIILNNLFQKKLIILPIINSTNQYLLDKIQTLQSGYACIAEHQTHGRGKYGRKWISSYGKDLCLSLYWHLNKKIKKTEYLSIIVSLITKNILKKLGINEIKIKWPNDLYLHNKKLAGILIECYNNTKNTTDIIIGIGINVNIKKNIKNYIFQKNWINLQETGIKIDRNILAAKLINILRIELQQFEKKYKNFSFINQINQT